MSDTEVTNELAEPGKGDASSTSTEITSNKIATNKVVGFHYRLAEVSAEGEKGEWMEQSHGGEPLYYLHGFHNVVVGLEKALEGKNIGDAIEITLQAEDAYGARQQNSIQRVPIKHLMLASGSKKIRPGMPAIVQTDQGRRNVVIVKVGKFNADVDLNHPLAGRILYYEVQVESIRDASAEEVAHGHVHGAGGHHH